MRYKYENLEEFAEKVDDYFEYCDNYKYKKIEKNGEEVLVHAPKPYTITGLCIYLNVCRNTLIQYRERKGFEEVIDFAKLRCESYCEEQLFRHKNPVGTIFSLKNNFGWKDKHENDVNMSSTINVVPPKFD